MPVLEKIEKNTGSGKMSSLPMPQCSLTKTLQSSLHGYPFILGSRIKNENKSLQKQILNQRMGMKDGDSLSLLKPTALRLIILILQGCTQSHKGIKNYAPK